MCILACCVGLALCLFLLEERGLVRHESGKPERSPQVQQQIKAWHAPLLREARFGDLPDMLNRHSIRVLIPFSKTNYFLSGGRSFGFEYSLLSEYGKYLNRHRTPRQPKVAIEFIPTPNHLLVPALLEGWGDIAAAGLTITSKRKEEADFTDPYLTGVNELVVSHKDVHGVDRAEDLSGRKVFVRRASSYYESLESLNEYLEFMNIPPVEIIEANEYLSTEDILEMVHSGIVELTVADSHVAELWSEVLPNINVHEQVRLRESGDIAWMVRKDNPELRASLNEFIEGHKRGTLLGNIYFNRYFKSTRWIRELLKPKEVEKLHSYENLFKRYAAEYGFDWKLIAAQAYQESGFDHSSRSSAGAIGLMQLMPDLANEERVGIKDFDILENNVQAGVKYLALLRDSYFDSDQIPSHERILFALAAYNAGPGRISKARELASRMGYDPNRWFQNSELGALKLIGQEPLRYVSNISKYYVAYSLFEEFKRIRNEERRKLGAAPRRPLGQLTGPRG